VVLIFLLHNHWRDRLGDCLLLLRKPALSFFDNWEEIFVGACLQFPLYFIVGWWVLPIMAVCGILWRLGGWKHGNKLFRRVGVPLLVCSCAFASIHELTIFLCAPFLVWIAPSYGVDSWLFKLLKNDFLTRLVCVGWYWLAFSLAYSLHG